MPLTPFQTGVVRILAAHRNPESHIAGGAVINRAEGSLRFSDDLDIFHDIAESVAASAEADGKALQEADYSIERTIPRLVQEAAAALRPRDSGVAEIGGPSSTRRHALDCPPLPLLFLPFLPFFHGLFVLLIWLIKRDRLCR
jgi:hypothetical protein